MRPRLAALAVAIGVLLASCSTVQLSYEHADWLLARMASRYVDLDAAQSRQFRAQLAHFHDWHRMHELPGYSAAFDSAAERVARGLSRADLDWALAEVRGRARALGARAGEQFAPVLGTLSEGQLAHAQRELEAVNGELAARYLSGAAARRAGRRADWIEGKLADWIGPLTPAQRRYVDAFVAAYPDAVQLRLEERRRRQAEFFALVRTQRANPAFELEVAAFLADPDARRSAASGQAAARLQDGFVVLLLDLDRSLTSAQRKSAVAKLRGYADDFRALSSRRVVALN